MSFDFVRKKECFNLDYQTWWVFIMLAMGCGWEPTGTGPPRGVAAKKWPGGYFSNDGQLLYARDAKRLAHTIEKVIAAPSLSALQIDVSRASRWLRSRAGRQDLCVHRSFEKFVRVVNASGSVKKKRRAPNNSRPWLLSRNAKSSMRDFVKFCRGGSFRVY